MKMYSDYTIVPLKEGKYRINTHKTMAFGSPYVINTGNEQYKKLELRVPFITKNIKCDDTKTLIVVRVGTTIPELDAIPPSKRHILGTVTGIKETEQYIIVLSDYEISTDERSTS